MNPVPVTRLDVPDLEPYHTLRETTQHWKAGFFVAEGENVVRLLLGSHVEVISFLMSRQCFDEWKKELNRERFASTPVYLADAALLSRIVGFSLHQNLMALAWIPPNPAWDAFTARGGIYVAVEGMADAENMGMIVRNCAAFGAAGLLVGPDSCSPWLRRAVRVSVGTVFSLPVYRCEDLLHTLREARSRHGWKVIGTVPRGGAVTLPPDGSHCCLLFGSEGEGLTMEALEACDSLFTIPMREGIDSLNVANAAAIVLSRALNP